MNKKLFGSLLAILLIGTMIVLMVKSNTKTEPQPLEQATTGKEVVDEAAAEGFGKGDLPPDFTLETITGDTLQLSQLKGKKVILNFWASWCGPCKAEMPHMQEYYEKYKDEDNVEIVAVNLTSQERGNFSNVEKFVDAYKLTFPIPLDREGKIMDQYEIVPIPTTYMIDSTGRIQHKILGPMDLNMMRDFVKNME